MFGLKGRSLVVILEIKQFIIKSSKNGKELDEILKQQKQDEIKLQDIDRLIQGGDNGGLDT